MNQLLAQLIEKMRDEGPHPVDINPDQGELATRLAITDTEEES